MCYNFVMQAIVLDKVSYQYQLDDTNLVAVNEVSLSIEEGSFVVLLGANGSGKSTLAKMLNGLLVPSSGEVRVFDELTSCEEDEVVYRIRSRVGEIFQNPDNQMVASVIEDDVAFGPENLGIPHEEIVERVDWALRAVGMEAFRSHSPSKLSGGQKQRVAIAGILAMRPKVLVLDESTAMLDPRGRAEVMGVLAQLNKNEGMTVVHITHHMDECVAADRAVVMSEGRVVFDGTPKELFSDPALVERAHLELPPVTQVATLLHENGLPVALGITDREELLEAICRLK